MSRWRWWVMLTIWRSAIVEPAAVDGYLSKGAVSSVADVVGTALLSRASGLRLGAPRTGSTHPPFTRHNHPQVPRP